MYTAGHLESSQLDGDGFFSSIEYVYKAPLLRCSLGHLLLSTQDVTDHVCAKFRSMQQSYLLISHYMSL